MAVESPENAMSALLHSLKLEDPWVPPRSWDSIPPQATLTPPPHPTPYPNSTLSEHSLVRLAINTLQGTESALISIEELSVLFCNNSADRTAHRIPSLWTRCSSTCALGNLLKSIGHSGCIVFLLHKFVEYFTSPDINGIVELQENLDKVPCEDGKYPKRNFSFINQAFAVAVAKVVDGYMSALNTLSASVSLRRGTKTDIGGCLTSIGHSEISFLEVYLHTEGLRTQMEALGNVCNISNLAKDYLVTSLEDLKLKANKEFSSFPVGGYLLSFLYSQLKVADPDHSSLLKFLFLQSYEPYCGFIRSWIYDGRISDPYQEFIVECVDELPVQAPGDVALSADLASATIRVRQGGVIPCFLEEFITPLLRAGQQLQVILKLLELYNNVGTCSSTQQEIFSYLIGSSSAYPWFTFALTFDKGAIETIVPARATYYRQMMEKVENDKFRFSYWQSTSQSIQFRLAKGRGNSINHAVSLALDDSLHPFVTSKDQNLPEDADSSEALSWVDEYSHAEDFFGLSESSSIKSSEEQNEDDHLTNSPCSNIGLQPSYLSSLEISFSLSSDNSQQQLSGYEISEYAEDSWHKVKEKYASVPNPCHDGTNICEDQMFQDPEIQVTRINHRDMLLDDHPENIWRHTRYLGEVSRENLDFLRTGLLVGWGSDISFKLNSANEDQHHHETGASLDTFSLQASNPKYDSTFFSMNPALNKSCFLRPRTTVGDEFCTNYRKPLPSFDFTSVGDSCKVYVDKLAGCPRSKSKAENSTKSEVNVADIFSSNDNFRGNNKNLKNDDAELSQVSSLCSLEDLLLPNVAGGSAWESQLGRTGKSSNVAARDHRIKLAAALEMPLDFVIRKCVTEEILLQYKYVSKLTIKLLIEGFELREHLLALRRYHFMELADWVDLFIMSLWHQKWHVKEADTRIPEIQGILESSIQRSSCEGDPYKDLLYLYRKGDDIIHLSACSIGIHSFDFLCLGYRVDWPINIILTPAALEIYSRIFNFLIQVKLAVFSLSDLWCSLKSCSVEQSKQKLNNISVLIETRQKVNHFISTLQQYVQSQLSQVSWFRFLNSLEQKVKDMMDLESVHMTYLTEALHICFLSNETQSIANIIQSILQYAMDLRSCYIGSILEVRSNTDIDITKVLGIRRKFAGNLKQLYLIYLQSPKPGEFGISRFWDYLDYNEYYSELVDKQIGRSIFSM